MAKFWRHFVFAAAQFIIEIPYLFVQTVVYCKSLKACLEIVPRFFKLKFQYVVSLSYLFKKKLVEKGKEKKSHTLFTCFSFIHALPFLSCPQLLVWCSYDYLLLYLLHHWCWEVFLVSITSAFNSFECLVGQRPFWMRLVAWSVWMWLNLPKRLLIDPAIHGHQTCIIIAGSFSSCS